MRTFVAQAALLTTKMSLKVKLTEDLKAALKAGDAHKRMVVGMILSAVKNKELEKRSRLAKSGAASQDLDKQSQLDDEEIIEHGFVVIGF